MPAENKFQKKVIDDLERRFPGAVVLKADASYIQGFPDLIFLYKKFWATLEAKRGVNASRQPNQAYWVERLDEMSFSRFVYPNNLLGVEFEIEDELVRLGIL